MEVLQDLDERFLETWNFQAVLDAPDEPNWVDFGADVLQQSANECYERVQNNYSGVETPISVPGRLSEYFSKSSQRSSSACSLAKSIAWARVLGWKDIEVHATNLPDITQPLYDERQCLFVVTHATEKIHHLWYQILFLTYTICLELT